MEEKKMTDKKKLIIGGAIGVIAAIIVIIAVFYGRRITAKVMRIAEIKGIVNLEDSGKSTQIVDNMRLHDGNALSTETESYVSVNLDDSKLVTVEEASRAEFVKSGKNIELKLTRGSLFFNVMKPLAKDASFDITTSTMVVGIRGTCGIVTMGDDGRANFYLIEGHVHITGINPVTKEKKEIDLGPGQKLTVYLFNDRTVDSVMFEIEKFSVDELTDNELMQIYYDDELMERIRQGGVLSTVRIEELVNGTRNEDGYSSNADPVGIGAVLSNDRPGPTLAVTPTPTATLTPGPTLAVTPTRTPTATLTPGPTLAVTLTPTPTPTITPTPEPVEEDDDDDDDDDEPTPEPTPTAANSVMSFTDPQDPAATVASITENGVEYRGNTPNRSVTVNNAQGSISIPAQISINGGDPVSVTNAEINVTGDAQITVPASIERLYINASELTPMEEINVTLNGTRLTESGEYSYVDGTWTCISV